MRRLKNQILGAIFLALCTPSPGCGASSSFSTIRVSYSSTARKNYLKGKKALKDKSFEEAEKYFKHVRSRFPFSKYATLAELRQGDVLRESEKFIAAISAYRTFRKEHPTHAEVQSGYIAYNIGFCYWKMAPSDFFILPPPTEKDQTSVEAAMLAFKRFLKRYPDSKYRKKAKRCYLQSLRRLAAHELYVARFYLRRDKPKGAIFRLRYLIRKYPDAGYEPEVMFLLGTTYLRLKKPKRALKVFHDLIEKHPKNYNAKKARRYLAFISREYGLK